MYLSTWIICWLSSLWLILWAPRTTFKLVVFLLWKHLMLRLFWGVITAEHHVSTLFIYTYICLFLGQGSEVYTQTLLAYIRYTHPPKPHSHPGHGTNVTPPLMSIPPQLVRVPSGSRTRDAGTGGRRSTKEAKGYSMKVFLRHKDLHAYGKICESVHKIASVN